VKRALIAAHLIALAFASTAVYASTVVPEGTVLPVRLNSTLSSKNATPGQIVTARIMQNVPLPNGAKIPEGATLVGHVTRVTPSSRGASGSITVRFDNLRIPHERILLTVHLRAIASFMEVEQAQDPLMGADRGTAESAWTTVQIGGDVVYRGGGPVEGRFGKVGEPVYDGVLGRLDANSDRGCAAGDPDDGPQALWLFSSNACGTYGLPGLKIVDTGRDAPAGEITFGSKNGNVTIRGGSGLLLRVNVDANPSA
jgi:hypothetical protein